MVKWEELIKQTTIKELIDFKKKPLVTLSHTTSLKEALETLRLNDILSAPVIDARSNTGIGFVDVLDIAGFVLSRWSSLDAERANDRNYARDEFFNTPISAILNFSKVDFPLWIEESKSVEELINIFTDRKFNLRAHRVAVLDSNYRVYNIVSQFDVIRFAHKNIQSIKFGAQRVKDLYLAHSCVMARLDDPLYETLETLYHNKISGIAIVDHEARLVGNFSASDLRGITQSSFNYFTRSTAQFLAKGLKETNSLPPITCTANSTLEQVLHDLASLHIHRIYVILDNYYPIGVVTLSDVLDVLKPDNVQRK